ncbi:MAG: carboxypeptidase regulatory-like domain-containing protein [Alphaproteobacteria bacterium]|nr:carboxypeptidase regulatory-like domain-containing protein [Alphaproteobacteria bacterium]
MAAPRTLLLLAPLVALGCGKMAIDGEVTDHTGAPLPNVMVTAVGTQCQTLTDESGRFELVCLPGIYNITIGLNGYISDEIEAFEAPARERYDLGKRVLIRIPDEKGLLLFDGQEYRKMQPGKLIRRMGGTGLDAYKHYCLPDEDNPVNTLPPAVHGFFDNQSDGWRPFRIDDTGCAYKMSPKSRTQWGVDYSEKPEYQERVVEQGKKIVLMELPPGRYFIADWDKGFFTPIKGEGGKTEGYSGFYLEVGN